MSLIGSLDDLCLGDILQIINLSQKSGVLVVTGDQGEGRIVFRDGLVRGAAQKGGAFSLRDLLVGRDVVPAAAYEAAVASAENANIRAALIERQLIADEELTALCRESVEHAVIEMLSWCSGEFSFDVRADGQPGDPEILLPVGINPQYLAMEGARVQDERSRSEADSVGGPHEQGLEEAFPSTSTDAVDLLAERAVAAVEQEKSTAGELESESEAESESDTEGSAWERSNAPLIDAEPVVQAAGADRSQHDEVSGAASREATIRERPPLVVIDPELHILEWAKRALRPEFPRVHIFQRSDLGLVRIRQYVSRAEMPLVLISPDAAGEPATGIVDMSDFVRRLKTQVPRMPIWWLSEPTAAPPEGPVDGAVSRPRLDVLRDARSAGANDELGRILLRELLEKFADLGQRSSGASAESGANSDAALRRLREATDDLSAASVRGEVLPRVIEFARESYSRVAMFMIREGRAVGMAQSGLGSTGGPDADTFRDISFAVGDCAVFERLLEDRVAFCASASEVGDELCNRLCGPGGERPLEAYVAPIESSGQTVALLYADHLPEQRPIGDTSALEVVLSHAGLALDRAVLERAPHDAKDDTPGSR